MKFLCCIFERENHLKKKQQWKAQMWGIQGAKKQSTEDTFELRHHVGQVVLQFGVSGKLKAHVIVGDSSECLWRIDAPLVQDAVDAKGCGVKRESMVQTRWKLSDHHRPSESAKQLTFQQDSKGYIQNVQCENLEKHIERMKIYK